MTALLAAACEQRDTRFKPVYPTRGQVLYEGKPAAGATVRFYPVGGADPWASPAARTDEAGNYSVSTYRTDDGLPEGEYEVAVYQVPPGYDGPIERANKLPARYASPDTSGLKVTIRPGESSVPPIQLTK